MKDNDLQHIKRLIDAFYEGATSPDEERILREYFSKGYVPDELEADKKIFSELYRVGEESDSYSLEQKLDSLIDRLDAEEKEKTPVAPARFKRLSTRWITGVAASALIVLSIGVYHYSGRDANKAMADTYTNPEDAYAETEKALLFVSNKLNKGFEQVESVQKNLEKTNKIISKNIQL